jgi:hypothetical protein
MSKPSRSNVHAITGFGIEGSQAVVIIPKKNGEEFDLHVIGPKYQDRVRPLTKDLQSFSNAMHSIVNSHKPANNCVNTEEKPPNHSHHRWTVLDVNPTIWGKQNQYIHVGFQYDLYYICDPKPVRKYLLMRTIGNGVSSGVLQHDNRFHRGYYQDKVIIDVEGYGHDGWIGSKLRLEEYAPQSENTANQEMTTLGVLFSLGGMAGIGTFGNTAAGNSGMNAGIAVYDQHSVASKFDDFTVSFLPSATSDQWMFWMNGAEGSKIRKHHQTRDLISNKYGVCTLKELPQLANYSVLQPDVQALYYTRGDQKGKWTITGKVEQHLRDVTSWFLFGRTKKLSKTISQKVTIDFSQVEGNNPEKCKE